MSHVTIRIRKDMRVKAGHASVGMWKVPGG